MLQATYQLSRAVVPINETQSLDVVVQFSPVSTTPHLRRALNLSLVIDRSGSMAGTPLKQAVNAARLLIDQLSAEDIVSVVIYDDHVETIVAPQLVKNKDVMHTALSKIHAGGCTNLSGGWLKGCEHVQSHHTPNKINRVLLLTDGLANVGITNDKILLNTAQQQFLQHHISTTTLGFGAHFNEDLLIGMAKQGQGNFYFIQTPEDLVEVFRIELESLSSLVAQNLTATVTPHPHVQIEQLLNNYSYNQVGNHSLEITLGDVYEVEQKTLALVLNIAPISELGPHPILTIDYRYQTVIKDRIEQMQSQLLITLPIDTLTVFQNTPPSQTVLAHTQRLRIAKAKEEAIRLADQGDYQNASLNLRLSLQVIVDSLTRGNLEETFELAEETDQLNFFATQLEKRRYNSITRKEMTDQYYQTHYRSRHDLSSRGLSTNEDLYNLPVVSQVDQGVVLQCFRESSKLRIKIISDGYRSDFNVQFPRHLREEGAQYIVDAVELSGNETFYRTIGEIRRLVLPGQEAHYQQRRTRSTAHSPTLSNRTPKAATGTASAADLETTDTIGDGVLVQCIAEGKKLRARVVSDGYDPNYNIRFPRDIRELGILYVVEEVIEHPKGGYYIACGKIKRLTQ